MAIVQISQIKHRRGTNETLPQLASAELGWSIDTRQLYIGNGTLEEGAPEVGNTEILTQYSNIAGVTKYTQTFTNNTTANIASLVFDSTDPSVVITYSLTREHTDAVNVNVKTGTFTVSQYLSRNSSTDTNVELGDTGFTLTATQHSNVCYISGTLDSQGADGNLTYTINAIA
jgi:hypothetical protein